MDQQPKLKDGKLVETLDFFKWHIFFIGLFLYNFGLPWLRRKWQDGDLIRTRQPENEWEVEQRKREAWLRKDEEIQRERPQRDTNEQPEQSSQQIRRRNVVTLQDSPSKDDKTYQVGSQGAEQLLYEVPQDALLSERPKTPVKHVETETPTSQPSSRPPPQQVLREQWAAKQKELDEARLVRQKAAEEEKLAKKAAYEASRQAIVPEAVEESPEDLESVLTPQELLRRTWGQSTSSSPTPKSPAVIVKPKPTESKPEKQSTEKQSTEKQSKSDAPFEKSMLQQPAPNLSPPDNFEIFRYPLYDSSIEDSVAPREEAQPYRIFWDWGPARCPLSEQLPSWPTLTRIYVYAGLYIDGLELHFRDKDPIVIGKCNGTPRGGIEFRHGDYLRRWTARAGHWVDGMSVTVAGGRSSEWCGNLDGGSRFEWEQEFGTRCIGIEGYAGPKGVDRIVILYCRVQ